MKQLLNRLGRSILRISLMVMLGMLLLWASLEVYEKNFSQDAIAENVEETKIMVLEANADKMGAVYVMKAGYDVCEGREFFKRLLQNNGDYLGGDHPGFAYRYSELNIGCE